MNFSVLDIINIFSAMGTVSEILDLIPEDIKKDIEEDFETHQK